MKEACRGFTLVELLIAMAILALLTFSAYRGLSQLIGSERQLAREQHHWQQLTRFFDRFEADLQRAVPRPVRNSNGREAAMLLVDTGSDQKGLRFSRAGDGAPEFAHGGQRLEYRWRERRIELLLWPAFDHAADQVPQVVPVLDGVASWSLRFAQGSEWRSRWPLSSQGPALPRAIEVTLQLETGKPLQRIVVLP